MTNVDIHTKVDGLMVEDEDDCSSLFVSFLAFLATFSYCAMQCSWKYFRKDPQEDE